MSDDEDKDVKVCKIVLVGESGVGKTSIASRFDKDIFDDSTTSTPVASFISKTLKLENDKCIKFEIWDTCGQEKYRSLGKIYYKGISAAILVYDITDKKSFEELDNFWIGQLKEYAPKTTSKFFEFIFVIL